MNKLTWRTWQLLLFLTGLSVFLASLYFEFVKGLQPCPLCLMQRLCVFLFAITCLLALILDVKRARMVVILQTVIAVCGLYFASRQLWLQSLPADQLPACLPGLDILMRYFPWRDVVHALMFGAADCGKVTWVWLGLSMPAWTALYFFGLLLSTFVSRTVLKHKP